jgi:hypothetical protein
LHIFIILLFFPLSIIFPWRRGHLVVANARASVSHNTPGCIALSPRPVLTC